MIPQLFSTALKMRQFSMHNHEQRISIGGGEQPLVFFSSIARYRSVFTKGICQSGQHRENLQEYYGMVPVLGTEDAEGAHGYPGCGNVEDIVTLYVSVVQTPAGPMPRTS